MKSDICLLLFILLFFFFCEDKSATDCKQKLMCAHPLILHTTPFFSYIHTSALKRPLLSLPLECLFLSVIDMYNKSYFKNHPVANVAMIFESVASTSVKSVNVAENSHMYVLHGFHDDIMILLYLLLPHGLAWEVGVFSFVALPEISPCPLCLHPGSALWS